VIYSIPPNDQSRGLKGRGKKIEQFLTHLAVKSCVAPSTQNQAMNALVFLYKKVLKVSLKEEINAIRAQKKTNIPVVMTREEVRQIINYIEGSPQFIVKWLLLGLSVLRGDCLPVSV